MAKRMSAGQQAHILHWVETKEQERSVCLSDVQVETLLTEMESPDPVVRARAIRQVCPCRIPWESFSRLRKAAKRLQHDPDQTVAAHARHLEEDAKMVTVFEARYEQFQEQDDRGDKDRKRRSPGQRR